MKYSPVENFRMLWINAPITKAAEPYRVKWLDRLGRSYRRIPTYKVIHELLGVKINKYLGNIQECEMFISSSLETHLEIVPVDYLEDRNIHQSLPMYLLVREDNIILYAGTLEECEVENAKLTSKQSIIPYIHQINDEA